MANVCERKALTGDVTGNAPADNRRDAVAELNHAVRVYSTQVVEHRCQKCSAVALYVKHSTAYQSAYRGTESGVTTQVVTGCKACGAEHAESITCWDVNHMRGLATMLRELDAN
jgi:hypothetical protein